MPFFTNNPDLATHTHGSLTTSNDPLDVAFYSSTFTIDEILLKKDIANNQEAIYQVLFENIKVRYPEKADEYDTLLRLNRLNYRYTVLSIEFENLKAETAKLTQDFENGFTF